MRTKEQIKREISQLLDDADKLRGQADDLNDRADLCEQKVERLENELEKRELNLDINGEILQELVPIVEVQGTGSEREALDMALRGETPDEKGIHRLRIMAVQFLHKVFQ